MIITSTIIAVDRIIKQPKSGETKPKVKVVKDLISAIAIYKSHTYFKVIIEDISYEVVVKNYKPNVIFSSKDNDYWKYPTPAKTDTKDTISDIHQYWDYLL